MNGTLSNNNSISVYTELSEIDKKYASKRTKKPIWLDLIKTVIASFLGAVFFPVGIICFFYFVNNKNKIYAYIILGVTLAYSNILILFINLYYLIKEAIEFSRIYSIDQTKGAFIERSFFYCFKIISRFVLS
jgi:hypothetical protein